MALPAPIPSQPRVGAFFDMDKTLIAENSGSLYMRYRYQRGEISGADLLRGIGAYLQYKLGILDIRNWTKNMMVQFRGRSEQELEAEANRWFEDMVVDTIYPEAEALVREHEAAGHVVAIVSGATKFVVRPLARRLAIPHFLFTRLEVENLLRGGQDLLAPAVHRRARDRPGEELLLHRLHHGPAAAGSGGASRRCQSRPVPLPRGGAPPLAGALLRGA
jgi:HAD superfamily phosphoserine phosphatase-like hydrolase